MKLNLDSINKNIGYNKTSGKKEKVNQCYASLSTYVGVYCTVPKAAKKIKTIIPKQNHY